MADGAFTVQQRLNGVGEGAAIARRVYARIQVPRRIDGGVFLGRDEGIVAGIFPSVGTGVYPGDDRIDISLSPGRVAND